MAELGQLSRLALPIVFTQLAQMGMSVADTVMAGRVSSVELAGVALGTVLYWPLMMLVSAFAGLDLTLEAYKIAIENEYRFFSYGDAMVIT